MQKNDLKPISIYTCLNLVRMFTLNLRGKYMLCVHVDICEIDLLTVFFLWLINLVNFV